MSSTNRRMILFAILALIVPFIVNPISCISDKEVTKKEDIPICRYTPSPKESRADSFVEGIDLNAYENQFKYCILASRNPNIENPVDRDMCKYLFNEYERVRSSVILVCKESAHLREDVRSKCKEFLVMEYEITLLLKSATKNKDI